jgi:hypothetical protein
VVITDSRILIGCEHHRTSEWAKFTRRDAAAMDGKNGSSFWARWKGPILALASTHQSTLTTYGEPKKKLQSLQ